MNDIVPVPLNVPRTPRTKILMRIADMLRNPANDLEGRAGLPGITVRHTRNRWANSEEKPAISIRMVADEVNTEAYVTQSERLCYLSIDLQIDTELQTEDSEIDPTGLERLGMIANAALAILKDPELTTADGLFMRGVCDDVVDEGVQADDDSEADEARFIHRVVVLYRTPINDPSILLAAEENVT